MKHFIQLHFLTVYPPSNPNRDDLGRPKTAMYGGEPRLRISSQAIKRAARISDAMRKSLEGHMGERTQRLGDALRQHLDDLGADGDKAVAIATSIAGAFGQFDKKKGADNAEYIRIRQLAFVSPDERRLAEELAAKALRGEKLPKGKDLAEKVLRKADGAVDIALFGRMLAAQPDYNREAACQISHAITTHKTPVEDDYYTAVDDLKEPSEDSGAGFVGEAGFGSGVYYIYACIDCRLLLENLTGDRELSKKAVQALVTALATSTPSGKRASFAHHAYASYIRAEAGDAQPRSLAGAFFKPITGASLLEASIAALKKTVFDIDRKYGNCYDSEAVMDVGSESTGNLESIQQFVAHAFADD